MKTRSKRLDKEIAIALNTRSAPRARSARRKPLAQQETRTARLVALQGIMADVFGDKRWLHTDLEKLEGWINVDDELPVRAWLDTAKDQLIDQSVLPAHAGPPPKPL